MSIRLFLAVLALAVASLAGCTQQATTTTATPKGDVLYPLIGGKFTGPIPVTVSKARLAWPEHEESHQFNRIEARDNDVTLTVAPAETKKLSEMDGVAGIRYKDQLYLCEIRPSGGSEKEGVICDNARLYKLSDQKENRLDQEQLLANLPHLTLSYGLYGEPYSPDYMPTGTTLEEVAKELGTRGEFGVVLGKDVSPHVLRIRSLRQGKIKLADWPFTANVGGETIYRFAASRPLGWDQMWTRIEVDSTHPERNIEDHSSDLPIWSGQICKIYRYKVEFEKQTSWLIHDKVVAGRKPERHDGQVWLRR